MWLRWGNKKGVKRIWYRTILTHFNVEEKGDKKMIGS
jgi:hypothetical protein